MMDLNRDEFRKWLEGHRPRQVVGRYVAYPDDGADWNCNCPIANFMKANGVKEPEVYEWSYTDDHGGAAMPEWGSEFVSAIDEHLPSVDTANITASRALKILDGIEQ